MILSKIFGTISVSYAMKKNVLSRKNKYKFIQTFRFTSVNFITVMVTFNYYFVKAQKSKKKVYLKKVLAKGGRQACTQL